MNDFIVLSLVIVFDLLLIFAFLVFMHLFHLVALSNSIVVLPAHNR